MNDTAKFNAVVSFLWAIADLLNGAFKKSEFQKIILPFAVLRRLDYALEATKAKVLETEGHIAGIGETKGMLVNIAADDGMTSKDLKTALEDGKRIIVTTLQKFGVIMDSLGELPGERLAVIVDEAHSSQAGTVPGGSGGHNALVL